VPRTPPSQVDRLTYIALDGRMRSYLWYDLIVATAKKKAAAKKKTRVASIRRSALAVDRSYSRRTITIPPDMEAAIDALVGRGKFSAFAQQAFIHELQRESIARWLDEREAARGGKPLSPDSIEFAEQAWRSRK
jgi:Arc/MetJ-type ribon-helix-helix transcriptional regulator